MSRSRTLAEAIEAISPETRRGLESAVADQVRANAVLPPWLNPPPLSTRGGVDLALPTGEVAPSRRYTLELFRSRITIDVASLKRASSRDPSSSLMAAIAAQDAANAALVGPEVTRAKREFQVEVGAKLRGKQRADFERQDAWLQAQSQGRTAEEARAERPFAWQVAVSPVQVTSLYDYGFAAGSGNAGDRVYELTCYGCAFVLPEDVALVESLAASRHQNVLSSQLPLTITPRLIDDPLLEARRLSYEEYVAFVDRLTGGSAFSDALTREPTPRADVDRTLAQILDAWNQTHDAIVAQHAPFVKNKAGRRR